MNLDLTYMLTGTPVRMRYAHRWATSRVLHPENVAEHSWFVCFYAMCVTEYVLKNTVHDYELDNLHEKVLKRAVLHDIEESRTGDIHRPFKKSDAELSDSLDRAGRLAAAQVLDPLFDTEGVHLLSLWETAKDDTAAGKIVAFADLLCVIAFVIQEGSGAAESLCLETIASHADKFKQPEYEFIRPLVDEMFVLLEKIK